MNKLETAFVIYIIAISLAATVVCIYDKIAAKKAPKHRIRESTLLWLSALGGSVAMLATMLLVRHKTRHLKFIIGIPVIIALQIALPLCIHFFVTPLF